MAPSDSAHPAGPASDPLHVELVAQAGFLRGLARGMLAERRLGHLAEDVLHEAFLRALAHPPAERGRMRAWLARVVRNQALNTARGERRRVAREHATAQARAESAADAHERATLELALQREVAAAVAALHEPYRTVVHLRYFRGHSSACIADELGVPLRTVETRLARAHALLRLRLERIWRTQDRGARAFYPMLGPAPRAGSLFGALWMTKQTVLIGLAGASLLGVVLTWRALSAREDAVSRSLRPAALTAPPRSESVELEEVAVVPAQRATVAMEADAPSAEPDRPDDAALPRALERLSVVLDRTLEGRLDPGAILDTALLVAAHDAGDALPELDPAGRLLLPIQGLPEGAEAELCVSTPNRRNETILTLQIHLARTIPLEYEGWERGDSSAQVTAWTNLDGELLHFNLLTEVHPERRAPGVVLDGPRTTYGLGLYTPLAEPTAWKLKASGLQEIPGTVQPDGGRSYQSGSWEVPQVLEGGPWPRLVEMRRLSQRLLELHAAVKARTRR